MQICHYVTPLVFLFEFFFGYNKVRFYTLPRVYLASPFYRNLLPSGYGPRKLSRKLPITQGLLIKLQVCCVDVNSEKGKTTVEELQKVYGESNCIFAKCDVSSSEEFEEAYLKAKESYGNLNILVNNAGVTDEKKMVDINLKGVINGCDIAFKYMGKNNGGDGGAVVNVSSVAALQVIPFFAVYSATKAGVLSLTRCYGQKEYYETSRIKFTTLCPCSINTPMYQRSMKGTKIDNSVKESCLKNPPMEPHEAAEAIIQLIEDGRNGAAMLIQRGKENTYVKFSEETYMN